MIENDIMVLELDLKAIQKGMSNMLRAIKQRQFREIAKTLDSWTKEVPKLKGYVDTIIQDLGALGM
jgi:hypothetical protein